MHTMSEMLSNQGNMIDRIDLNVEASLQHIKAANVAFSKVFPFNYIFLVRAT